MSTNRKNRDKPVLRNMVRAQNVAQRSVLNIEAKLDNSVLREIVDNINETIQKMNRLVSERNIPYIRIDQTEEYFNLDKTRILLRSELSDSQLLSRIEDEFKESDGNTFLVELYLNSNGYVEIGCADGVDLGGGGFSNFILVDYDYLSCALIDVFLDSALFNSYSYLNEMTNEDKRHFNQLKVAYLKNTFVDFTSFNSPFYTFNNKNYSYLSMAFFARESENCINLTYLIDLWNSFVKNTYPNASHIEQPVEKQLTALVDINQYSKEVIDCCKKIEPGCYWLLRIHRVPVNAQIRNWLVSIFGQAEIGSEKIIPFSQFEAVYELVRGQHITAFKFIVQ